jgi:HTH-type transcriptional regulator/antitoxin HigA
MTDGHKPLPFEPDWISPPGETLADLLEERGWSQTELATRTDYTEKHISLLINGKASITEDTALKLERVVGSSAHFWLSREALYREFLAREQETKAFEKEGEWLKELPLKQMIDFGWVRRVPSTSGQIAECLKFFGVASIRAWRNSYKEPLAAFRASKKFPIDSAAATAWLRQGEKQAASIACEPFDRAKFKAALIEIRRLTNETDPEVFIPALVAICSKAGVAVVFEPAPKGCPVSGAAKWLSPEKALLILSLRHRSNDHLWFSFFHEAGHLLLHGKRMTFIDVEGMLTDEQEDEANRFSRDVLIPPAMGAHLSFLAPREADVIRFSKEAVIAPGIVVGRMQKEGYLPWSRLNHLKVRYSWKRT